MQTSTLTMRLNAMRATIRRRLVLYGVCSVLAGGVGAFLAVVTVDWLLRLPGPLRVFVAGLFLLGMVGAVTHWIVKPMLAPLSPLEIAGRIERYFGNLQDRLVSTVEFLKESEQGSPGMIRQVVADTDRILEDLPLDAVLTKRPLAVRLTLFLLAGAALASVMVAAPGWARTGLYRYLIPFGGIDWPRSVEIVPLTGAQSVAMGESVSVKMAVARGLRPALRVVVHLREPDGTSFSLAMQRREEEDEFYATIDAVTSDLAYWFEAGDDSTKDKPFAIHVVRRPEVMEALATIEPPPYASDRPARTQDLFDAPLAAPVGGFVTIRVRASKPLPSDPAGSTLGLRRESGELITLEPIPGKADELSTRFEVLEDMRFRIELRDELGFKNRGARQYTLSAVSDAAPNVMLVEPRSLVELTPNGSVSLVIRAEDDFGISTVDLHVDRGPDASPQVIALTDRMVAAESGSGVAVLSEFEWHVDPGPLQENGPGWGTLNPGDVLVYWVTATDNRVWKGLSGQVGRSARQRIKIISDTEFDTRIRDELAILERRLQESALDQAEVRDGTAALANRPNADGAAAGAPGDDAGTLSARQAGLIRRVRALADRFARLGERLARNQTDSEEFRRRLLGMDGALRQVAGGPMSVANAALGGAAEPVPTAPWKNLMQRALDAEDETVARLNDLLRTMSQWGGFQELMTRTRDLLRRQETVRDETISLGKSMLGKSIESLTRAEAAALKRVERRQEQVATDVEEMLANMGRLRQDAERKDGPGAKSIEGALRAAGARDLTRRQWAAREAIASNRTAAAALDQKAAAEALRAMVAALQDRRGLELAQLKIRLRRAEDQVAYLIEAQRLVRAATQEAAMLEIEDESLDSLAERQHGLTVNARLLGDELATQSRISGISRMVQSTAAPMARAEDELRDRRAAEALSGQDEALALLEQARAALEELAHRTAQDALRYSLARIRQGLDGVRSAQVKVNQDLGELRPRIESAGRLSRRQAREASKLARRQTTVMELLNAMRADLHKVPVYEWALQRVANWMGTSRDWFASRKIDAELTATTNRIVDELDKLIGAIREAETMPMEREFAEAEGGSGGEGQQDAAASLPTVTELLVLKAMQFDINQRTTALQETVDWERTTEEQLRVIKTVGEDQAAVRRLTELVLRNTR